MSEEGIRTKSQEETGRTLEQNGNRMPGSQEATRRPRHLTRARHEATADRRRPIKCFWYAMRQKSAGPPLVCEKSARSPARQSAKDRQPESASPPKSASRASESANVRHMTDPSATGLDSLSIAASGGTDSPQRGAEAAQNGGVAGPRRRRMHLPLAARRLAAWELHGGRDWRHGSSPAWRRSGGSDLQGPRYRRHWRQAGGAAARPSGGSENRGAEMRAHAAAAPPAIQSKQGTESTDLASPPSPRSVHCRCDSCRHWGGRAAERRFPAASGCRGERIACGGTLTPIDNQMH
eukprot:gene13227-biopygen1838